MRIAYVTETYPPEINGVALTVARAVSYLRQQGHTVDLIRPSRPDEPCGAGADELRVAGSSLPMYPEVRFGWPCVSAVTARLRATRPQLVHVATPGPLCLAAVSVARHLGIVTTSDYRTDFGDYAGHYHLGWLGNSVARYLRWFHNRTQRSFVPTELCQQRLSQQGFRRLAVVGRGVDVDHFNPSRRDPALRKRWNPAGGPILLHVGRLAAEKNVGLALRAAATAAARVPGTKAVVVGDGPMRHSLQRQFPHALFVGMQTGDALAASYASADVFLFPSLSDTFGNVTLEALASGLPVVAFNRAAAAEHMQDGVNGQLIEPNDSAAFVRATCQLAGLDEAAAHRMRLQARQAALAATWSRVLAQFEQHLLEACNAQESHRPAAQYAA
jgi:glycosyltransferase involved in cell wall biosynthesis